MATLVEVFGGPFTAADLTPLTGKVIFRPSTSAPLDAGIVTTATVTATLDGAGEFTAQVVDSDDPGWGTACPMHYTVEVRVDGLWDKFTAYIPAPGPHDLADLIHLDAPPHVTTIPAVGPPGPEGPQGPAGQSDHGLLVGLGDDDHPQYLTTARGDVRYPQQVHTHTQTQSHMSPDTDTAPTALHHTLGTGANQAAAGTHTHTAAAVGAEPSGAVAAHDASTTAHAALRGSLTPAAANADAPATGSAAKFARDDHKHQVTTGTPVALGSANAAGSATGLARADHVHVYPTAANVGAEPAGTMAGHLAAADPHPQYAGGGGGVTDHGALTGLGDDDHPQYLKPAEVLAGTNVTVDTTTTPGSVIINGTSTGSGGLGGGFFVPADHDLIGWSYDPAGGVNTLAPTAGQMNLIAVKVTEPTTITAVVAFVGVVGSGLGTNQNFAALYDSSGTRVGITADQGTAWTATGTAVMNLTTPYPATPGVYYVALVSNGTTRPAFARAAGTVIGNAGLAAGDFRFAATGSGLTTPPASFSPAAAASVAVAYWVAILGTPVPTGGGGGGSSGSTILSGTATPTGATGAVGDYYLDTDDQVLYGPKVAAGADEYVTQTLGSPNSAGTGQMWAMKFRFNIAGYVKGIRLRTATVGSVTGWEVYLFSGAGALLASKDAPTLTANAWNQVDFDVPVAVAAGTTYVASYWVPNATEGYLSTTSYAGQTSGNVVGLAEGVDGPAWTFNATRDTFPATPSGAVKQCHVSPVFTATTSWPVALKSIPPGGTTGQVLAKTSAVDYAAGWGNPTPGRNRIINGDMSVNQRGFTTTTTTGVYGLDRWQLSAGGGGTVTYSAQTAALGDLPESARQFARLATTGQSTAGHYAYLQHRVEGVRTLSGKMATVSFWARAAAGTPSIAVNLDQDFGTGGSPSTYGSNPLGKVTISTTWTRYSITKDIPSLTGKTIGTAVNDYLALLLWTSAGSSFTTMSSGVGLQNATIDIWGVQVEEGPVATPYEQKTYADELRDCQRYYQHHTVTLGSVDAGWSNYVRGSDSTLRLLRTDPVTTCASITVVASGSVLATNPTVAASSYAGSVSCNTGTAQTIGTLVNFNDIRCSAEMA